MRWQLKWKDPNWFKVFFVRSMLCDGSFFKVFISWCLYKEAHFTTFENYVILAGMFSFEDLHIRFWNEVWVLVDFMFFCYLRRRCHHNEGSLKYIFVRRNDQRFYNKIYLGIRTDISLWFDWCNIYLQNNWNKFNSAKKIVTTVTKTDAATEGVKKVFLKFLQISQQTICVGVSF